MFISTVYSSASASRAADATALGDGVTLERDRLYGSALWRGPLFVAGAEGRQSDYRRLSTRHKSSSFRS